MRRSLVWLWCFAAGIAVGFMAGRAWDDPVAPAGGEPPSTNNPAAPAELPAQVHSPEPGSGPRSAEVAPPPTRTPPALDAPAEPVAPTTPGLASVPVKAAPPPFEPSVDSGVVQAIDVGEAFAKQIARPSQPGFENQIGDAHRELERELRDEQWAYEMEGTLQDSMVSQTSMGAFKVEHVECRSTICEVRLSGRADQQAGLREWNDSLRSTTLNGRLLPNMSSTVGTDERVDALYIFRRPARKP
jgi:hypothetical protein